MIECDFHNARWQLWYQDMFDPETPRLVEAEGLGLELGLGELWSHHLTESVLPNGARGFARFNLWWVQAGRSFSIEGEWQGQVQLRNWVFPPGATDQDEALLHQIAKAHLALVLAKENSVPLLSFAAQARSRDDFDTWLSSLVSPS